MGTASTLGPVSGEMQRVGRLFESLANSSLAPPQEGANTIVSPTSDRAIAELLDSEGGDPFGQADRAAVAGEGVAANSRPSGVSDKTWRSLAPYVKHVVSELKELLLTSRALTILAEDEKDLSAIVLLPGRRGVAPRLLAMSGGMRTLLDSNGHHTRNDSVTEEFLLRCQQVRERGEERIKWQAGTGMDFWLSLVTTVRLPNCEIVLVHLAYVAMDHGTISECRQIGRARGLTGRQIEVLELLSCGLGNREIAHRLRISYHTARAHLRDIFTKLSVSNRIEAINAVRARPEKSEPVGVPKRTGLTNAK